VRMASSKASNCSTLPFIFASRTSILTPKLLA
jgi:hypothetical protein